MINLYDKMHAREAHIRACLPYLKLDADPRLMSNDGRARAANALRMALAHVEAGFDLSPVAPDGLVTICEGIDDQPGTSSAGVADPPPENVQAVANYNSA